MSFHRKQRLQLELGFVQSLWGSLNLSKLRPNLSCPIPTQKIASTRMTLQIHNFFCYPQLPLSNKWSSNRERSQCCMPGVDLFVNVVAGRMSQKWLSKAVGQSLCPIIKEWSPDKSARLVRKTRVDKRIITNQHVCDYCEYWSRPHVYTLYKENTF